MKTAVDADVWGLIEAGDWLRRQPLKVLQDPKKKNNFFTLLDECRSGFTQHLTSRPCRESCKVSNCSSSALWHWFRGSESKAGPWTLFHQQIRKMWDMIWSQWTLKWSWLHCYCYFDVNHQSDVDHIDLSLLTDRSRFFRICWMLISSWGLR